MNTCCQQDDRRDAVRAAKGLNGLDYVEVSDDQLTLTVFFLGKLPPELSEEKPGLKNYLKLSGGQRVTDIQITQVTPVADSDPEKDDQLVIELDKYGDFSTYALTLVGVKDIDPRYQQVEFNFKVNCPSDLDCAPICQCQPEELAEPEINYLAKDYSSFRQLVFDRLALLVPDWKERHVPDLGVALVELLAYTGDYLSYYQDAVATEAYLDTARQRISVRRHARLVGYKLHEGCNARAWIVIKTDTDFELDLRDASFITGVDALQLTGKSILNWSDLSEISASSYEVFAPMELQGVTPLKFYAANSEMYFYTWGEKECCIERGSTSATLLDGSEETSITSPDQPELSMQPPRARKRQLEAGDILIFEEMLGPVTGDPADADPTHRHAVRLTKVSPGIDPLYNQPIIEIEWAEQDALPFPLCISAIGRAPDCKYLENITVARGNVILVDHGTIFEEDLGEVPTLTTQAVCECADHPSDIQTVAGLFRPHLSKAGLTFRAPLPKNNPVTMHWAPAASLLSQDVRAALPQVQLGSQPNEQWTSTYDLIESGPGDRNFVVEIDNDGVAYLRFGDGELGFQPTAGRSLHATYRLGNGVSGNVGAEAICCLVLNKTKISGLSITVRNPLPAQGGTDAESMVEAKLFAPSAIRDPKEIQRAIVAEDYALIAGRNTKIQRASAALVWTGSWYEADVAIDPLKSEHASDELLCELERGLRQFRRIGHDLHVLSASYVPLDLKLDVCALPGYLRAHVKAALLDAFSNRALPGGGRGFFHPDNLTFGEGIFLSRIIATAQAVTGVECVTVTRFHRLFESPNHELENGVLPLRVNEIAQLDNDPNYPEHGKLEIDVKGGR